MPPKSRPTLTEMIQNGVGTVMSRMIVIFLVPATLGLGGWIGMRVVGTLDNLVIKVDEQHTDTVNRINGIDNRVTGLERDVVYLRGAAHP